jgi:UDP-N-acetyl-D-mannosaminuronate dehydrogenase
MARRESVKILKMKRLPAVGVLGYGEIGSAMARIAQEAGYQIYIRELDYDTLKGKQIDYLYINIPEKRNKEFIEIVALNIREFSPKLTIINSSITPGTTRKIFALTKSPIVHSPVIGLHPNLYTSIKKYFRKVVAPIDSKSRKLAEEHFRKLGLKVEFFTKPENSEASKLLDLIYFAWNIVFCKWVNQMCNDQGWDFSEVYKKQNEIYNQGYARLLPNSIRPILIPVPGPITGHCTIPDTELIHKLYPTSLTSYILKENKKYFSEVKDLQKQRQDYLKLRNKLMKK